MDIYLFPLNYTNWLTRVIIIGVMIYIITNYTEIFLPQGSTKYYAINIKNKMGEISRIVPLKHIIQLQ